MRSVISGTLRRRLVHFLRRLHMGRVKAMAMELEERFADKALDIVDECETWHQFSSKMESYMDLVNHMGLDDVMNMLAEIWTEYEESTGKEAYGGMVKDD
jgi:hypothetical protein